MEELFSELERLETNDYQKRKGITSPESDIPDSIEVTCGTSKVPWVSASFKNTSEKVAGNWLDRYLKGLGYQISKMETCQDGDYHNDWVVASAEVKGKD